MDSPKISVIVPMFNSARFIRMCIASILNQTFTDFEVLVVDDCSDDDSVEILRGDSSLKIIENEKHLGIAATRNIGLKESQGKYIFFVDADSAIFPQTLETFFTAAEDSGADVIHMNSHFETFDENFTLQDEISAEQIYDGDPTARILSLDLRERIGDELLRDAMNSLPGRNLYRRDFLIDNELFFPETSCCDDLLQFDSTILFAQKFMVLDSGCYLRRIQASEPATEKLRRAISSLPKIVEFVDGIFSKILTVKFAREAVATIKNHVLSQILLLQAAEAFSGGVPFEEIEKIEREEFETFSLEDFRFVSTLFNATTTNLLQMISLQNQQQVVRFEDQDMRFENRDQQDQAVRFE